MRTFKSDVLFGDYYMKPIRMTFFDSIMSFVSYPIFFISLQGELFTALEKLLAPFERTVWLLILISFLASTLMTFIINFHNKNLKISKFSEKLKNPSTMIILIAVGSSQPKSNFPKKCFAKFFIILFIFLTLNLRSIYQGSLYKFLQLTQRHKIPKTIKGLIDADYEFIIGDVVYDSAENYPGLTRDRIDLRQDWSENEHYLDDSLRNTTRKSVLSCYNMLKLYSNHSKDFNFDISDETFVNINIVMYFRKNFYLKEAIDLKLYSIVASGIIEKFSSVYDHRGYWKNVEKGPKTITLEHLSGVFYLLMIGYIFGIFIFSIELYSG